MASCVTEEGVNKWLEAHPDFIAKYLVDHPESIKKHLKDRPKSSSLATDGSPAHLQKGQLELPTFGAPMKVGAEDMQTGGDCLKAISDTKLQLHFPKTAQEKSAAELRRMPKYEMLMELVRNIAYDLDINSLSHKILLNVNFITYADRSSLFLVEGDENNTLLVSRLFDVTEGSSVQDALHTEEEAIKIPLEKGIIGHAAQTGQPINIRDAYEDPRFNKEIDLKTGYRTRSILCMPIKNHLGEVIGVAQVMNKCGGKQGVEFTEEDEEVFSNYLTFCGIGLTNAKLYQHSICEYRRNQVLLQLAHGLFEEQTCLDHMVQCIMMETQELVPCDKCYVLLRDMDSKLENVRFSQMFEKCASSEGGQVASQMLKQKEAPNAEVALAVMQRGKTMNISNPESSPLQLDEGIGNVLCIPVYNKDKEVIGVAQMANKANGLPFTTADQKSLEMFATFCGLGIHNVMMYERIAKSMARQKVTLEMLSYHASATVEETDHITSLSVPLSGAYNLESYAFDDRSMTDEETVLASMRMFYDCNLHLRFNISRETLCCWILTVKKNYRKVTYHNWRHAFNVAQIMFAMLKTGLVEALFSDTEKLALLVACFCHDLDHRGTNNAFQSKVESPLAQLYSTSTMENHHFDHSIMILNSEGNNILGNLTAEERSEVQTLLEQHILSTDLALYFQKKGRFINIVENHIFDWSNKEHRDLLKSMLMTACDVAAITKPWNIQHEVAHLVASEFFEQGDRERNDLQLEPIAMMDRQKEDELPRMQVGFIDGICLPLYKELYELHPPFKPLYDGVLNNRDMWQALADEKEAVKACKDQLELAAVSTTAVELDASSNDHLDHAQRPIQAWQSDTNTAGREDGARREGGSAEERSSQVHKSPRPKLCNIL